MEEMMMHWRLPRFGVIAVGTVALACAAVSPAPAQNPPPSPVRYTEAREHAVRRTIDLPGSVESRTSSLVAGEVEGLVMDLLAREGDTVRMGQPVARLRTEALELRQRSSRAQLKEAEARLKVAELTLARARELYESKVASEQQFDETQYEFNARAGHVEQLAAEIARIEHDLSRCTIRAPFAGVVTAKHTEVGQWLPVGGPVIEMMSLADIEVRVEVPERYFQSLDPRAGATITFDSLPGLQVMGRVSAIIPRADPQARTFPVKLTISNKEGRIGIGMLARVSLPAGGSYRATVVPKDAVVSQGAERVVYVINDDQTVSPVKVQPHEGVGSWIVIEGAVQAGQRVVTRGNERLRPGLSVQAAPLEYELP